MKIMEIEETKDIDEIKEIDAAKSIISELAHGVNPLTGEELPQNSLYNDLDVIRALFCLLDAVQDNRKPGQEPKQEQQGSADISYSHTLAQTLE